MTAYAIGRLKNIQMGLEIRTYLEGIDETLRPFKGRFLVHGGAKAVMEGAWPEDLIMIAFPDMSRARDWYDSPAYQEILPLRLRNAEGDVILVDDVGPDHKATDVLKRV